MKKERNYEIAEYVTDGIEERYVTEMSNFLKGAPEPHHQLHPVWWIAAAAMLVLVLGAATWNIVANKNRQQTAKNENDVVEWKFSYLTANEFHEDGWFFCFNKIFFKDDSENVSVIPYSFSALNLRYRYVDQQSGTVQKNNGEDADQRESDQNPTAEAANASGEAIESESDYDDQWDGLYNNIVRYGQFSGIAVEDMNYIDSLLCDATDEELLALRAEELPFTEIDPEWFVQLVRRALTGEAHREGNYVDIGDILLAEPEFVDGYKFQIGCVVSMGCIDAMYIDVLYESDTAPHGYIQLSDMVDAGLATAEQAELFSLLQSISCGAMSDNDLLYGYDENNRKELTGVSLFRLYDCLKDMETNNLERYYHSQED